MCIYICINDAHIIVCNSMCIYICINNALLLPEVRSGKDHDPQDQRLSVPWASPLPALWDLRPRLTRIDLSGKVCPSHSIYQSISAWQLFYQDKDGSHPFHNTQHIAFHGTAESYLIRMQESEEGSHCEGSGCGHASITRPSSPHPRKLHGR